MGVFAWRNLLTRPMRTLLALIGLSIPILGVLGLFSLSDGLRNMVGDTLSQIEGVIVLRENTPSPVASTLSIGVVDKIRAVPGVRAVAPEVWGIAPNIEGQGMLMRAAGNLMSKKGAGSIWDQPVISGQDYPTHKDLKSAVFPRALKERGEGRFLDERDVGKSSIVISRKIARNFPNDKGEPRKVGDRLLVGEEDCEIVGIYETGSMLLDVVVVMDIQTARRILKMPVETVSSIYVEAQTPPGYQAVCAAIEAAEPGVSARSMNEVQANFGMLMGQVDKVLMMIVSLALLVGVVGIVNTMLMSTTERFVEFGVLRTNGWSQANVLGLVTLESAYLGLLAGVSGCVLAWLGTLVANQFVGGGLRLGVSPFSLLLGLGLSVATGVLGGLYPAWRAARMVPMEAIRLGSH
ncbi:ABC transporter permease [Paludisphaera soli]|uniref:ABC transporter permease n=1 Tax=Paludisphaera soli TaxID=2712865 RepID=UPI0013EBBF39|nr:ABC transporter permease [Paludisphaera soli]